MSRKDQIVDVARELLEAHGSEGVTMRAIAERLEIRAPSLYKHIADKHEVEVALIAQGFAEQATAFAAAIAEMPDDPVGAIGIAYRQWALANPHLYALMTATPLPRNELPDGIEEAAAAPILHAVNGDADQARALWAFGHGMVSLELAQRFPPDADLDAAWVTGLNRLAT